mmetsp:Transcript_94109/g.266209  ORF Transcript_94109/g.266209 Transcript_94109/m.266209 type:complete len:212 (+) Transcript_94109:223-858(+)
MMFGNTIEFVSRSPSFTAHARLWVSSSRSCMARSWPPWALPLSPMRATSSVALRILSSWFLSACCAPASAPCVCRSSAPWPLSTFSSSWRSACAWRPSSWISASLAFAFSKPSCSFMSWWAWWSRPCEMSLTLLMVSLRCSSMLPMWTLACTRSAPSLLVLPSRALFAVCCSSKPFVIFSMLRKTLSATSASSPRSDLSPSKFFCKSIRTW